MTLTSTFGSANTEIAAVSTPSLMRRTLSVEVLLVVAFIIELDSCKAAVISVAPVTMKFTAIFSSLPASTTALREESNSRRFFPPEAMASIEVTTTRSVEIFKSAAMP